MPEFYGKTWYTNFTNHFTVKTNRFYVRATWKGISYFTEFEDYYEFALFTRKIPKERMCFYELIPGSHRHRLYFDIDGPDPSLEQTAIDEIVDAIIQTMREQCLVEIDPKQDIVICKSSSAVKLSLHIIVSTYYVSNNTQVQEFFRLVQSKVPDNIKGIMDSKVYTKLQNFRIVGCTKESANRYKYITDYQYHGETIQHQYSSGELRPETQYLQQLLETIIGCPEGSGKLVVFPEKTATTASVTPRVDDAIINKAILMLNDYLGFNIRLKSNPIVYKQTKENMIILQRNKASACKICNRRHEHENPYAMIQFYFNHYKLYYSCRRCEGMKCLGIIDYIGDDLLASLLSGISFVNNERLDIKTTKGKLLIDKPIGDLRLSL